MILDLLLRVLLHPRFLFCLGLYFRLPRLEPFNASARIYELLGARVERVAFRADVHGERFTRGTHGERVSAGAFYGRFRVVGGMYFVLHTYHPYCPLSGYFARPLRRGAFATISVDRAANIDTLDKARMGAVFFGPGEEPLKVHSNL
jgi:hypothetical protein